MSKNACYHNLVLNETLPFIDYPFYNESLIGYLLRLDYINGYSPSTLLKQCTPIEKNKWINKIDYESIENLIDSNIVSRLTNISPSTIEKMKIKNIRRRLYKYNCTFTMKNFSYGNIKICPECIKQWKIPQVFFFDNVNKCILHGLNLISECSCGSRIQLLNNEREPYCNNKTCRRKYKDLSVTTYNNPIEYDSEYALQNILKTYLSEDISFVQEKEKLIKGLLTRINYLEKIKRAAGKAILYTKYVNNNSEIIFPESNRSIDYILNLSNLISLLNEFSMFPYEFLNINSDDVHSPMKSVIEAITCHSLQDYKGKLKEKFNYYNFKATNRNIWSQALSSLSYLIGSDKTIFYDVKVISGKYSFLLKCCAYKKSGR